MKVRLWRSPANTRARLTVIPELHAVVSESVHVDINALERISNGARGPRTSGVHVRLCQCVTSSRPWTRRAGIAQLL